MLLEDYGLIGDFESAALVGRNGAIDWLCLPRFDSASCFSALLGGEQHGRWLLAPAGEVTATARRYRPGTLVLETEFETADGAVRVIDFMPPRASGPADRGGGAGPRPDARGTERAPRLRDDPAVGRARVRRRGRSSSILALDQPRSRGSGRPRREPAPSWRRGGPVRPHRDRQSRPRCGWRHVVSFDRRNTPRISRSSPCRPSTRRAVSENDTAMTSHFSKCGVL
jgi:hypothetical protein